MDFLSRFIKIKPDQKPKLKLKEDKRKDFFVILSREQVGDMLIFHAKCKKKFADKDIAPLTKMFEKQHKCDVSLSISPDDPHILKMIFHQPKGKKSVNPVLSCCMIYNNCVPFWNILKNQYQLSRIP